MTKINFMFVVSLCLVASIVGSSSVMASDIDILLIKTNSISSIQIPFLVSDTNAIAQSFAKYTNAPVSLTGVIQLGKKLEFALIDKTNSSTSEIITWDRSFLELKPVALVKARIKGKTDFHLLLQGAGTNSYYWASPPEIVATANGVLAPTQVDDPALGALDPQEEELALDNIEVYEKFFESQPELDRAVYDQYKDPAAWQKLMDSPEDLNALIINGKISPIHIAALNVYHMRKASLKK